ncbi:hypothetical protein RHD99_14670 [Buttiauxella selenatireducens]|uniref:Mu-like prophage FluMu N-terminal domain-containing protein n=1 Tax=Buttiauxella selenatireducens TaxID=3073902 RepID=A0ABY9S6F3_9ENTR|nr:MULTISPECIES: hypothetical protein [unclassified Buttiauxella]WMY72716.1 hypothetical protein RHD99_14670 [Buttiauxella sp. R73]GDX06634.1 hypothetical protein BSPA111_28450 [Buttiauxella sp. A111]
MASKKFIVVRGIEHPGSGHWLDAGTAIELTERQAKILQLNGHIKPADEADTAQASHTKKRK